MASFSRDTLLLDAMMADETLFDRLTAAFPVYRKFAKVLLREDIAGQLTLADAAHMADLPVAAVLAAANCAAAAAVPNAAAPQRLLDARPAWLEAADEPLRLDVRPLLEAGHEPLADLLAFAGSAPAGAVLAVDATFHPLPLRRLFGARGYESFAEPVAADHWRVYFRKAA